jgi:hypothetical protein
VCKREPFRIHGQRQAATATAMAFKPAKSRQTPGDLGDTRRADAAVFRDGIDAKEPSLRPNSIDECGDRDISLTVEFHGCAFFGKTTLAIGAGRVRMKTADPTMRMPIGMASRGPGKVVTQKIMNPLSIPMTATALILPDIAPS